MPNLKPFVNRPIEEYSQIDPPIRQLVKLFNDMGFKTYDSCCGWNWSNNPEWKVKPLYIKFKIPTDCLCDAIYKISIISSFPYNERKNTLLWTEYNINEVPGYFSLLGTKEHNYLWVWHYDCGLVPSNRVILDMVDLMNYMLPLLNCPGDMLIYDYGNYDMEIDEWM